ncbi:mercuric resistance operon regulatory protein MerR [Planococcus donghaensis MPA1U2]|uniref:Mercuric resistance operon regulatory protein n=1 Tax=Planococcus donghaensis MPA1U2 TaxID=933115 RepID=E7RDE8_9BACL|nr:Hg(II)-responsive transcriptional regulator [Planococcus donghaensis]EGA90952.1 mercuric resistance operon regulatory protein MerR [Planococcus donghaensis MPA1U2]
MSYRISELAALCHVNKETIRYYERKELLEKPIKNNSGYRIYSEETVKRVGFIRRLQELGFSLNEIYKLLGIVDKDDIRCENMFTFVSEKELEVQKQIEDLKRVERMLGELKDRCPDKKELHECSIIDVLMKEE